MDYSEFEGGIETKYMAAGGLAALAVVVVLIMIYFFVVKGSKKVNGKVITPPVIVTPPPRPTTLSDCGYQGMPRGWYDIKGVGYKNDFCRYGGDASAPIWFCKIFNGTDETHTYDPNMPFDPYTDNLTGWHCP